MVSQQKRKELSKLFKKKRKMHGYISLFLRPRNVFLTIGNILKDKKLDHYDDSRMRSIQANSLIKLAEHILNPIRVVSFVEFVELSNLSQLVNQSDSMRLGQFFLENGSDKFSLGYHEVYQVILASNLKSSSTIVEIGIGTNHLDTESNMGRTGIPGASLRAFRDYDMSANIVGLDVDSRIFISETRIWCYFCDQNRPETISRVLLNLSDLTLLIDDGLHNLDANLNTFKEFYRFQEIGSWIVIEDIQNLPEIVASWQLLAELISRTNDSYLIQCRKSILFCSFKARE